MDNSATSSADEAPESWEVADVDASLQSLMISRKGSSTSSYNNDGDDEDRDTDGNNRDKQPWVPGNLGMGATSKGSASPMSEEMINSVDQFLREAIQNPRERLSVLRMEQDIEKFIRDSTRDQMEFQQLPTSYLRLAAHRVAQHYSLQSMVLMDTNVLDGSGSRIIVQKTSNMCPPLVRLADIPVSLPSEESGAMKVAIKQRPQKGPMSNINSNFNSVKSNSSKSVEERKEEYNRARARIFSSNNSSGTSSGKSENTLKAQDNLRHGSRGGEDRISIGSASDAMIGRSLSDSSVVTTRSTRSKAEKEPIVRPKNNSKVAIFRDHEIERKDPDYDRSYDRYMQRFDPGFGFAAGPYAVQPMYAPAMNYNTEFPQLGSSHRPPVFIEHQPRPIPQHLPGHWIAPSAHAGMGYAPTEAMLAPFSMGPANARPGSGLYLHSVPYPSQRPGMPYVHHLEQVHQPLSQSHLQQSDASFGLARPR